MFIFPINKDRKSIKKVLLFIPFLGTVLYWITQNIVFINSGLLHPNFDVIFECYRFNLNFLPILLIILGVIYSSVSFYLKNFRRVGVPLALFCSLISLSLFALNYYITEVEPRKLLIRKVEIDSNKVTEPITIVHFSDVQSAKIDAYEERIFKTIQKINADLILYTGDFLQ